MTGPRAAHDAAWAEQWKRDADELLTLAAWLGRDIPDPDFLLGEFLSTTARVELIGPTGIGKTNVLVAGALAVASGEDFLHWRGAGKPRRVLYVDGEMSRRLSKKRLVDAVRRHGGNPETFFFLNREDFPDLPPLNTEAGQEYIDAVIDRIGGVDLVVFDNVQALLSGDMKDEAPWQQTLPWVRDLTRRCIGQIWAHHTGHDTSHGYGSKTREWQMDTVALMSEIDHPAAAIAFTIEFIKARERTPENRADFDPVTITLQREMWSSSAMDAKRSGNPSPLALKFHDALLDALARCGERTTHSANHLAVTKEQWTAECVRLGLLDSEKPDSQRALLSRHRRELLAANFIACNGESIWNLKGHR